MASRLPRRAGGASSGCTCCRSRLARRVSDGDRVSSTSGAASTRCMSFSACFRSRLVRRVSDGDRVSSTSGAASACCTLRSACSRMNARKSPGLTSGCADAGTHILLSGSAGTGIWRRVWERSRRDEPKMGTLEGFEGGTPPASALGDGGVPGTGTAASRPGKSGSTRARRLTDRRRRARSASTSRCRSSSAMGPAMTALFRPL